MSNIEDFVRPFQTPDVAPSKPYFIPGKAGVPPVIMQFGRGGGGRVFTASASNSITSYMTQYDSEKKDANWGTSF